MIDPNHQRFFKQDDLMDLFSYNDDSNVEQKKSMTGKILKNMNMDIEINKEDISKMEKELDKKEKEEGARQIKESSEVDIKLKQQQQEQQQQQQQNEENISPIKEYPQSLYDSPMSYNSPMNNTDNSDWTYNEMSVSSNVSSTNSTSSKKKKRYSCDTVDNNIKQSKYTKVRSRFMDDDHQQMIKNEIDNIEGIEYTEDFKVPSKNGDEEEDEEDENNDLFTQSEDEDSDSRPQKKKSRKGKEKTMDDGDNGNDDFEEDDFNDMDLEKEDDDKSKEYQSKDELRILKNLMNITGAVSVIEHDKIMDSKKWNDIRDDKEAEKIANNAVKKLRKFMERRRHIDISIPTWTGR